MAIGSVGPGAKLVFDNAGSIIGIENPSTGKTDLLGGLTTAQAGAVAAMMSMSAASIIDVTRPSLNDATDANEVTLATLIVPPNLLKVGSIVEVMALFENPNSVSTKTYSIRVNGTGVGNQSVTTLVSTGFRFPMHVHDVNTLIGTPYATSSGGGTFAGVAFAQTITGVIAAGFTVTLTAKWGAAVLSESIVLRFARLNLIL